ncbi:hypothetical protein SSPO_073490 [Streptomyces antimycoticus]|uniref:Uncharacterized protein n=1 Tax=Streptomyces antimycoticus TaxID=68175 RepID=A0A499V4Z8_9ACTN|nr:hypothetical protein SSPO_073490 [Streptomyces antimycoticus]
MRAEADPVGVADADAGGDDIVGHPGELVDTGHRQVQPLGAGGQPGPLHLVGGDGAERGPGDVGQQAELAVQAQAVRLDEPVAEQMQPQIDVMRVQRLLVQRGDDRADGDDLDAAPGVRPDRVEGGLAQQLRGPLGVEPLGPGRAGLGGQLGGREPGVQNGAVLGEGGETGGDGAGGGGGGCIGHGQNANRRRGREANRSQRASPGGSSYGFGERSPAPRHRRPHP